MTTNGGPQQSDLATLMSIDPLGYSEQQLDQVVDILRRQRHQFQAGNMKAGSTKAAPAKQQEELALRDKIGEIDL